MAPAMPKQRAVHLPDNEEVARLLLEKHRSMLETNIPDNLSLTLSNAYRNVCAAKEPIRTLKDLLKIKGVGPWVIRLIKESFPVSTQDLSPPKCKEKGRKGKKIKRPEHNPELVCSNSASMASQELIQLTSQEQFSYSSEVRTDSNCSENIILSGPDSDEPFKGNNPFIGPEHFVEERDRPKLKACSSSFLDISKGPATNFGASDCSVPVSPLSSQGTFELQSSSTMGSTEFTMLDKDTGGMGNSILAMPPCLSNEMFLEVYEVVLILDDREIFGSRGKRVVDNIHSKFHVPVEIKRLPVGDCIWIARHRRSHTEYVLDFIVERKSVTDLVSSIRDSRYKDQKLRLKVETLLDSVKWDVKGLAVAIAQNVDTGAILMQGFANKEALAATMSTRKATFYSRSRSSLWTKGETSMNFINVHDIFLDCDRDSIIYLGTPDGPTCHTGAETCYYSSVYDALQDSKSNQERQVTTTLYSLEDTINRRKEEIVTEGIGKPSWTKKLLLDDQLLCSKIREEAGELIQTLLENEDKTRTASEMADLLYHAMVLLSVKDVKMEEVLEVLRKRFSQSGVEEKASRKKS